MDLARYAELFRTESREHLAEIETALLALERDGDPAHIAVLFRSTHTIKGMAASMGYRAVEHLSHGLETLLDALRSGARTVDADVIALLFDGTDALAQSVNDAVEGRGHVPSSPGHNGCDSPQLAAGSDRCAARNRVTAQWAADRCNARRNASRSASRNATRPHAGAGIASTGFGQPRTQRLDGRGPGRHGRTTD